MAEEKDNLIEISDEKTLKIKEITALAESAGVGVMIFPNKETMENAIKFMRLGADLHSGLLHAVLPPGHSIAN